MCSTYACQRVAHAEVVERRARRGAAGGQEKEKAAPVFCYKIIKVHSQRDFDAALLVGAKRRNINKTAESDTNVAYLVYRECGENDRDAGFKDTRWVELTDLLTCRKALHDLTRARNWTARRLTRTRYLR